MNNFETVTDKKHDIFYGYNYKITSPWKLSNLIQLKDDGWKAQKKIISRPRLVFVGQEWTFALNSWMIDVFMSENSWMSASYNNNETPPHSKYRDRPYNPPTHPNHLARHFLQL